MNAVTAVPPEEPANEHIDGVVTGAGLENLIKTIAERLVKAVILSGICEGVAPEKCGLDDGQECAWQ